MRQKRDAVNPAARYIVGIDLGTTNTVVAYAAAGPATAAGTDEIQLFAIEQLVALGEVAARPALPSVRYQAAPGELAPGALQLPWPQPAADDKAATAVFGSLARKLGAQVPGRLVASAKSWLSHAAVDRLAPILPWGAAAEVGKVSPLAASASYLAYVRAAWNWQFPDSPLERQELVLTVPASFDEGARALTLAAAREAGLPQVSLLEEPQAACQDWLFRHRQTLAADLAHTRLVLVCDVGGGTTDLSLIRVAIQDGQPVLTRIGVGNHLMLGGDNMDLALAHLVEQRMAAAQAGDASSTIPRLSAARLTQLVDSCRTAKELLLAPNAPERTAVTLLGGGARLIGGTTSVELTRTEVESLIVDGFFPRVGADATPKRGRSGIVEFGLPYASDPAVTRHVAAFLRQHVPGTGLDIDGDPAPEAAFPDTVLLNGGVFHSNTLAERLADTLADWRGAAPTVLVNDNPDAAVARGAVAFALARKGRAPTIGGGSARSYFLVLDADGNSTGADSSKVRRNGICILPRGSEPGHEILLEDRRFALRIGQPVGFHLVSSTASIGQQAAPRAGEIVAIDGDDSIDNFVRLPPLAMVIQAQEDRGRREIPVQLVTTLTEVGTLALHCVEAHEDTADSTDPAQRWLLEFQLRGGSGDAVSGLSQDAEGTARMPPRMVEAIAKIERIFGARMQQVPVKDVRQLRLHLEQLLGKREHWHTPLLRQLFDTLMLHPRSRRRSAEHERVWLNLAGYCLRPGFDHPLDDWRIEQLWPLFEQGVQHPKDSHVCAEWWTLWRRVAGGLGQQAQIRVLDDFAFNLQSDEAELLARPPTLVRGTYDDMVRVAASLERIPVDYKVEIGSWLLGRIPGALQDATGTAAAALPDNATSRNLWAIGRIGARELVYGSANDVVPPEVVTGWLEALLALDWKRVEPAAFAAAHMARMTGDRTRDLPDLLRTQIVRRLSQTDAAPTWIAMVREVVELDAASTQRILGESLPPGLKLIR